MRAASPGRPCLKRDRLPDQQQDAPAGELRPDDAGRGELLARPGLAARTWARRGHTPVIRVRGCSRRRISIAALTCYKPGEHSRLIYRPRRDDGRKNFAWTDYRDLLITPHAQLGGPIVLVWDNLNVHLAYGIRQFIAGRDWLTVYQLPSYAPDLNPIEGIWSLLRRRWLSNTAFTTPEHLIQTIRHGMRKIQYRPHLIAGCLTGTCLSLTPTTS